MAEQRDGDGRHDAVRGARDAWETADAVDPSVLAAVQDGLLAVPAGSPTAWFGVPRPRPSREQQPPDGLHRRQR